ncbi:hypothetical protein HOK09_04810 [Candidatus Woesearchaeota archaeon]|nr:hypothetical protein [Candidatus Woesearchaeota archaeon]
MVKSMEGKKFIFNLLSVFTLLVLTVSLVSALGISPAKKIVDFEDGLNFESEFKVVNTLDRFTKVSIGVEGELSKYVVLEKGNILSLEANKETIVKYSLNIPKTLSKNDISQGNNDIYFTAREIVDLKENLIGTSVGLISLLRVKVPHDTKYISSDFYIYEGDVGSNTIFVIPVENLGVENLSKVSVALNIHDGQNTIDELKSKSIPIVTGERKEIRLVWPTEVNPGEYFVNVILEYDSKINEFEDKFIVEGRKMSINDLIVGEVLGDAVKFEVTVKNIWNEELNNVYAEISVYDLNNLLISSFVTSKESISKRKEGKFTGHIDVGDLEEGEYITKLRVHYGNKDIEQNIETTFYENKFVVEGVKQGYEDKFTSNLSWILLSILIILIMINLVWMHWFKRRD